MKHKSRNALEARVVIRSVTIREKTSPHLINLIRLKCLKMSSTNPERKRLQRPPTWAQDPFWKHLKVSFNHARIWRLLRLLFGRRRCWSVAQWWDLVNDAWRWTVELLNCWTVELLNCWTGRRGLQLHRNNAVNSNFRMRCTSADCTRIIIGKTVVSRWRKLLTVEFHQKTP